MDLKKLLELHVLFNLIRRQGVLLIEEPEIKLHPGYMRLLIEQILELLKQNPKIQLFITTHSIEFLKLLIEKLQESEPMDFLSVIRMYRYGDGEIDYEVLTGSDVLTELIELEQDLRGI